MKIKEAATRGWTWYRSQSGMVQFAIAAAIVFLLLAVIRP